MYGRKTYFQAAIVIFLAGSALAGLSSSMLMLIIFRAVQGIGGGGLMIGAQSIIGDVVSPRDRGRYQGLFGAVFGVSSVLGPLVGGLIVDNLSWRWVFYVNLPIGAIALAVTAAVLPGRLTRVHHVIDYLGAALVSLAAVSLVLLTSLGGTTYAWASSPVVTLGVTGAALIAAFVWAERRAREPVLPLNLFASRVFSACSAIGFVVGFAMFGAITFLPLFLQIVQGVNPTVSGLRLLPLMAGLLTMSIGSGFLISKFGHYKVFPILGTALMTVGLLLLSRLGVATGTVPTSLYMFVLGAGLGSVMQVLVIAVQNAVGYEDLGAATSGVTFFRSMGGSFGTAVFGTIFATQLGANVSRYLKGIKVPAGLSGSGVSPQALAKLSAGAHAGYAQAYAHSLQTVFLVAAPIAAVAFVLSWWLPEVPLRKTTGAVDLGDTYGMPSDRSSLQEMERALSVLMRRENRSELYRRLAARADLKLDPAVCWLLLYLTRHPDRAPVASESLFDQLTVEGLARRQAHSGDARAGRQLVLTAKGSAAVQRLLSARHDAVAELLEGWSPTEHDELRALVDKLAADVSEDDNAFPVDGAAVDTRRPVVSSAR